jgi:MoaA/NifB/PqqE/SkfB family radical SAM enzyme
MNMYNDSECFELKPFFGAVELTTRCNSRCVYCRNWRLQFDGDVLDQKILKDVFRDFRSIGVRRLVLTGGEPLLRNDLASIVREAYSCQLYTSIVTNGRLLNDTRLNSLLDAGLLGITISLDSLDPHTYKFLRGCDIQPSLEALNLLSGKAANSSLSLSVNCVLTAQNFRQVPDLLQHLSDLGLPLSVQPCNTYGQNELQYLVPDEDSTYDLQQVIDKLLKMKQQGALLLSSESFLTHIPQFWLNKVLPEGTCYYGEVNLTVNHKGDVLPCWLLPAVGNVVEGKMLDIWKKEKYRKLRSRMLKGHCPHCWLSCSFDWQQFVKSESMVEEFWQSRLTNPET